MEMIKLVSIPFIAGQWSLQELGKALTEAEAIVSIPFIAGQWSLRDGTPPSPEGGRAFQSPSLRGSGRFSCGADRRRDRRVAFQSPSLRGSGRFGVTETPEVTSTPAVSIPFIAGQWSLRRRWRRRSRRHGVSIPFIAGQWSLQAWNLSGAAASRMFQSPSLRGSGRFRLAARRGGKEEQKFQSPSLRGSGRFAQRGPRRRRAAHVSIPFIAGQWSLQAPPRVDALLLDVSIPFIAGQWSLPRALDPVRCRRLERFNPLHCGAVVASGERRARRAHGGRVSIPFIAGQWSLPLLKRLRHIVQEDVSIPFIAGQWSLQPPGGDAVEVPPRCFNPLHCGAVVASRNALRRARRRQAFQSPSLRGSGRFERKAWKSGSCSNVSIPFIAGQWSLRGGGARRPAPQGRFQSPSLRGSGRFGGKPPGGDAVEVFQSPSLRGSGRFLKCPPRRTAGGQKFQSPSLRGSGRFWRRTRTCRECGYRFNPLHCGAVVASLPCLARVLELCLMFQSPSLRGSGRFGCP